MKGDPGPYVEMDGPRVWVPRTVPYLQSSAVARQAIQEWNQHPAYRGKVDATLMGFVRDCQCDEVCERRWRNDEDTGDRSCDVPAWAFEIVENAR